MLKKVFLNNNCEAAKLFFDAFTSVFTTKEYEVCDITNVSQKINMANAHVISFLERLKNCNTKEELCCTFSEYARKFNYKKICLVPCDETADFTKLLSDNSMTGNYYIACYSDTEFFGFLRIDAIEPDIPFIVYLANLAAMVLRFLKTKTNEQEPVFEVHESKPFDQSIIECGIPANVTKYIPKKLLIHCELNDLKKTILRCNPGLILIGPKPRCDFDEILTLVRDVRRMYAAEDVDIIFFQELQGSEDLNRISDCTKFLVISPLVLDNDRFKVNLRTFLRPRQPVLDAVYTILNEVYSDLGITLNRPEEKNKYGLAANTLNRYSARFIGMTLKELEDILRVDNAKKLIDNVKTLPLSEVAKLSKFDNYVTFQNVFNKLEGCSPLKYRHRK